MLLKIMVKSLTFSAQNKVKFKRHTSAKGWLRIYGIPSKNI